MEKIVSTLPEFEAEAEVFARGLRPREDGATLVTLSGELGAGKTAFTKVVANTFGVTEVVNSPTFVLEKVYALPNGNGFTKLVHIDAYRLEKGDSLTALGLEDLMKESSILIFFEWPERVEGALPSPTTAISITMSPDNTRTISYG